jgi:VIT1/CCC1 family predicted Fe2+/Mn2+ transporter
MNALVKSICRIRQTKFSFGATSAIITNMGIIVGLNSVAHPRTAIVGAILVIAIADNIADSLGIHIYQESECLQSREIWFSTMTNFFARLFLSASFIAFVLALPLSVAIVCSIVWGYVLLSLLSYTIAKARGVNTALSIFEHICIATLVIIASSLLKTWFLSRF